MIDTPIAPAAGDRLAKVIARSGLCSRRDAEGWIKDGRVAVNGTIVRTPAFNVTDKDRVTVDGEPLAARQGTRVWLYHKPAGLVVTEKDPEGRPTIFEKLEAEGLPRVVTIGRLDINTEGLLLLTNDGGLKRVLELPATGWLRRYRVRAHGTVTQAQLDRLKDGVEIEGVKYGPIEAMLEREQASNVWLLVGLREGKNREVKNVLASLGLVVNRLIRVSYGPFQLGDIPVGAIETVKARVLRDQLGKRLAAEAEVDFDSDLPERPPVTGRPVRERASGRGTNTVSIDKQRFRFIDRAEGDRPEREAAPRKDRPGRTSEPPRRPSRVVEEDAGPARKIHFDDGRESTEFKAKSYGKAPAKGGKPERRTTDRPKRALGERSAAVPEDRPKRVFKGAPRQPRDRDERPPRPARPFSDRPRRDSADAPRAPRTGADRPRRAADGGVSRPRSAEDRPKRNFGDRPPGPRVDTDRPRKPRQDWERPRVARPADDRPRSGRPAGDRPRPPRPAGDKPRSARPAGDRPRTPRPQGDRPSRPGRGDGSRPPRGAAPSRGPRKPRP